ncbi:hypothetical protein [Halomonas sp. AOP42-E1-30]|uniref:hypothetical protein n=1 Tax=Halomonas sp. AOP42-E1-30 TaxID=3457665 RepID=UPI004034323B
MKKSEKNTNVLVHFKNNYSHNAILNRKIEKTSISSDSELEKESEVDKDTFHEDEYNFDEISIDVIELFFYELKVRHKIKFCNIINNNSEKISVVEKYKCLEKFREKHRIDFYNLKHDLSNLPKGKYSGKDVFGSNGYFHPYKQFND